MKIFHIRKTILALALVFFFTLGAFAASAGSLEEPVVDVTAGSAAGSLVSTLDPPLAQLVTEVLGRNPDLARLRAATVAAELRAPQVRALPDPIVSLSAFLLTPETRVGPQEASAAISQRFPWFGKLALREREALYRATASRAEVEAKSLELVTEARRLVYELAFLAAQQGVVENDRATLAHFEEIARARYASGVGLEQAPIKLQAEISKDDNRLLEIRQRRATLEASLEALRGAGGGREAAAPLLQMELAAPSLPPMPTLLLVRLGDVARQNRPEIARANALIAAAETASEIARAEFRPDVTLGLGYTAVGGRDDAAGRAMPPTGNGRDILALTVGVNLPIWRRKLQAGVDEAAARSTLAAEELRAVETRIDQSLAELAARLPLTLDQVRLFENLLLPQAETALDSALSAYSSGALGAIDLLDAERILLEARIGTARLRADYLIALARLEGALGAPLLGLKSGDTP